MIKDRRREAGPAVLFSLGLCKWMRMMHYGRRWFEDVGAAHKVGDRRSDVGRVQGGGGPGSLKANTCGGTNVDMSTKTKYVICTLQLCQRLHLNVSASTNDQKSKKTRKEKPDAKT